MSSERQQRTLKETLPSSLDSYQGLLKTVLEDLAERGWNSELFGIEMALEESITNAIRHGNKLAPDKRVHVEFRLSGDLFWAQICDEGDGFDPKEVPNCRCDDRLEVPGGRGLALMCHYMSKVEYNEAGNCLTIEKYRNAPPG